MDVELDGAVLDDELLPVDPGAFDAADRLARLLDSLPAGVFEVSDDVAVSSMTFATDT